MHMNDERAAEGLDHLQAAALEMIAAARAFLDVAEDLVADRDKVSEVVAAFGTIADAATQATRDAKHRREGSPARGQAAPAATRRDQGVQHIKVS
jgi:hypothetical protein